MSSAITNVGQTRINELQGASLGLDIDRMIFAMIPGLDDTAAIDRSMLMPPAEQIAHTEIIAPNHKGYVNPDQVVYSVILGSDIGDFTFNLIGLIETGTNNLIAVSTMPETPKRATNLGNNTTGNMITRNFVLAFQDAQNLTAITVSAETWQFDYLAELSGHEELIVARTSSGETGKHLTDTQAKELFDHIARDHLWLADFLAQKTIMGFQKFPSGLILQWLRGGYVTVASTTAHVFPITFPHECLNVLATARGYSQGTIEICDSYPSGVLIGEGGRVNHISESDILAIGY